LANTDPVGPTHLTPTSSECTHKGSLSARPPRSVTPRLLNYRRRARQWSRSPRPSQTLDPGSVGEPFGEQSRKQVVGNIRCRGKRRGGRPRRADQIVQNCTRQIQIHQEVLVRSACPVRRLSRWHGQVAADPLERKRMENRTVNKKPVPQPALGAAAEFSTRDGQVARALDSDRAFGGAQSPGDPVEHIP